MTKDEGRRGSGAAGSASRRDADTSQKRGMHDPYARRPIYKWLGIGFLICAVIFLVVLAIALAAYRK